MENHAEMDALLTTARTSLNSLLDMMERVPGPEMEANRDLVWQAFSVFDIIDLAGYPRNHESHFFPDAPAIGSVWETTENQGSGDTVRVTVKEISWMDVPGKPWLYSVGCRFDTGRMAGKLIHVDPGDLRHLAEAPDTKFDDIPDDTPF